MTNPLAQDLDHVLAHTEGLWQSLRGERLFITGGTGFFGSWLLESFCWAVDRLSLGASAVVLTRSPDAFRSKAPHLTGHRAVELHQGDIRTFSFPTGRFSCVVHAASETTTHQSDRHPLEMFDTILEGTRRALEFANLCGAKRFLLTSSGAVYGRQPSDMTHIPEEYVGAPDSVDPRFAYGQGKRAAESLCALQAARSGLEPAIARCFAFVGPYLPLNGHYAVGNFVGDALSGAPIRVKGDGTPYRSYLYASDLAIWMWTILLRGVPCRPYNVGSEQALTIAELAETVASCAGGSIDVEIAQSPVRGAAPERYVPSTQRASDELGLTQWVGLTDAIRRTMGASRQGMP